MFLTPPKKTELSSGAECLAGDTIAVEHAGVYRCLRTNLRGPIEIILWTNPPVPFPVARDIRQNKQANIIVALAIALLAVLILLLAGIERTGNPAGCRATALLLHYFLLSAFCWMAVEAYNLYVHLIKIFDTHVSHFMLKAIAFAQGKNSIVFVLWKI